MNRTFKIALLTMLALVLQIMVIPATAAQSPAGTASSTAAKYTFAVFGDNQPERSNLSQTPVFKRILSDIDAGSPAFAVSVGDCICGSSDIAKVRIMYKDYTDTVSSLLKAKLYQTMGNHDIENSRENQRFFTRELGRLYYSFDYADSHFIVLDSEIVGEEGRIAGEQLNWLKEDLHSSRSAVHKFVFIHRPLFPVSGHIGSSLDVNVRERDALHKLFAQNKVSAVFTGHEHLFYHQLKDGVHYIITGGAGGPLFPSFFGTGDFHHYISVSVSGEKVAYTLVRADSKEMKRIAIKDSTIY